MSLTSIQSEIKEVLEDFTSLSNVKSHVDEIEIQLRDAYKKIKVLDKKVEKELRDIEELEKIGIKSLFHKTLGDKDKQLEKERQEYLEISLKYNEYKKSVELMEFERDLLAKKLNNLDPLKRKLEDLKNQRLTEILRSSNSTIKTELQELLHKTDVSLALNKELEEAILEGEKSIKLISVVSSYLTKAGEWGRWDMYGDNRRAAYLRKQAIDKARRNLSQAQHQLNLFARELKDLGENNITFNLDLIHFNKFTDFFFDNLISDWIIQQRIKSTLNSIESTKDYAKRILLSLIQEKESNNSRLVELNKSKDSILTK